MAQLIGLICIGLFFVLGFNIVEKYFDIDIKNRINGAFFLLICAAVCEFIYKSVSYGAAYDGALLEYALNTGGIYNFICGIAGKFLYGKSDIVKLMLGMLCLGLVLAEFKNAFFFPFIFLCFTDGGAILLFVMLALKYADKLKISILFALCAIALDWHAVIVLVYIITRQTELKKYAMYFYGAAALMCGMITGANILFAPAYSYAIDKISDKYEEAAIKTISVIFMGYSLISMF